MKKVFKDLNLVDGKYVKRAKFMSSKTCAYMVLHSCCNTFCLPSCKNPIIPLEKWLTSDFSLFALYIPLYKSHYAMQYRNKFTMCSKAICNVASTHIVTSPTPPPIHANRYLFSVGLSDNCFIGSLECYRCVSIR